MRRISIAVVARNEATKQFSNRITVWIASRSLVSGAHSRDPLASNRWNNNDGPKRRSSCLVGLLHLHAAAFQQHDLVEKLHQRVDRFDRGRRRIGQPGHFQN